MKKIIYTCDCCGAETSEPMQLIPTMVEGGVVNKYEHMTERHFCQNCTDFLIRYSYGPVTVRDIIERSRVLTDQKEKSDEENQKIIEALNAELEQLRGVDPEEVQRLRTKNDEMAQKMVRQKSLIDQLRSEIEHLQTTGKAKPRRAAGEDRHAGGDRGRTGTARQGQDQEARRRQAGQV